MYLLRRTFYYLMSLVTLLRGVRNWPELFRLLRPAHEPITLSLRDGTRYTVRSLMDAWIVKETNLDRQYEKYGVPIEDGWNIVDIGAGLGDFTVFAAQCAPHGRVYAYEPAPESATLLRQNLTLNGIGNVQVFPYAVAARAGTLSLDVSGGVAVQYRTASEREASTQGKITVRSVTLTDVLDALPGGICDFLKMDCEGAEYEILLNLDDSILSRIHHFCLEYHEFVTPYSHVDLVRYFESKGCRVRVHPSTVRRELGFLYAQNRHW